MSQSSILGKRKRFTVGEDVDYKGFRVIIESVDEASGSAQVNFTRNVLLTSLRHLPESSSSEEESSSSGEDSETEDEKAPEEARAVQPHGMWQMRKGWQRVPQPEPQPEPQQPEPQHVPVYQPTEGALQRPTAPHNLAFIQWITGMTHAEVVACAAGDVPLAARNPSKPKQSPAARLPYFAAKRYFIRLV